MTRKLYTADSFRVLLLSLLFSVEKVDESSERKQGMDVVKDVRDFHDKTLFDQVSRGIHCIFGKSISHTHVSRKNIGYRCKPVCEIRDKKNQGDQNYTY